jgi:large subunit ribosomal protein L7e
LKELKDRRDKERKERAEKRKALVANAEKYHNEYKAAEQGLVDSQRKARAAGNFFVPAEPKIVFAIRTRG